MAEPSTLGEGLRRYRVAAGLTQEELAERAGISARAVSDLERGIIQTPRKDTLQLLADALGLPADERAAFTGLRRHSVAAAPGVAPPALLHPAPAGTPEPGSVAAVTTGAALPAGTLTFLIADVRGYTAYTHQHGDEAGARLATRFAALAGEAVSIAGGQVVEVRGDELLAVFTSARKALRAAVDLLARCEAAATPELPLQAGVGLDAGEPLPVPGGYRGEAINVAARLCAKAGPGEVLASEGVVQLARRIEGLAYEERGPLELKGIPQPIRSWLVRDQARLAGSPASQPQAPSAVPAPLPRGGYLGAMPVSTLVAREHERTRIERAIAAAAEGEGQLLLLAGEPGVGKTRLAQEAMLLARERGLRVLVGRCYEEHSSIPFFPFVEALTTAWGTASPTLRQAAPQRYGELGRLLPELLSAPPLAESEDPRLRVQRAVAGFLAALAAETPLALLLDDLHWADSASLGLLAYLTHFLRGDRALLLGTYRDVEVGRQHPLEATLTTLTRDRVVEVLVLRGLSPEGIAGLIRARFGVETVSEELRDLVHERTEGNPFFTEEVLSALVEQGALFRSGDGWDRKALAEVGVPQSVRAVVGQRVGRLAPEAQELLRLASVLGQEFELDLLLGAVEQREGAVLDHLEAALAMKLLEERRVGRGERYAFAHALIAQTLYDEVPRFRLRRLHRRAGEALERVRGERPEAAAELARHFLAAGDSQQASRYAILAGDHALGLYAAEEAVGQYEGALELLLEEGDEAAAAEVRRKLGGALHDLNRRDEALAAYALALQTVERWRCRRLSGWAIPWGRLSSIATSPGSTSRCLTLPPRRHTWRRHWPCGRRSARTASWRACCLTPPVPPTLAGTTRQPGPWPHAAWPWPTGWRMQPCGRARCWSSRWCSLTRVPVPAT